MTISKQNKTEYNYISMKLIKNLYSYLIRNKKLSAILIVIIAVAMYFFYPKDQKVIDTIAVKSDKITQSVSASGTIESESTINLSFISSGKLTYVGVKKGDEVVQGQTIATLDQRTILTNLETSLIEYSKQRNNFDSVKEDNNNNTPQSALNDDMKRLLQNNQYDLDKTINSVELQRYALDQSVLVTPISGIVTRADAQVAGLNVSPTTIYTISDLNTLVFNIDVDEADIGKVAVGQNVNITFDAYPDQTVPLTITSIDFASHTSDIGGTVFTVKAALPENAVNTYRLGMNGDAEIIIEEKPSTLAIPISSVIDDQFVYAKKDATFEKRKITTGLQSDTEIEVIKGLKEGELIALIPEDVEEKLNK